MKFISRVSLSLSLCTYLCIRNKLTQDLQSTYVSLYLNSFFLSVTSFFIRALSTAGSQTVLPAAIESFEAPRAEVAGPVLARRKPGAMPPGANADAKAARPAEDKTETSTLCHRRDKEKLSKLQQNTWIKVLPSHVARGSVLQLGQGRAKMMAREVEYRHGARRRIRNHVGAVQCCPLHGNRRVPVITRTPRYMLWSQEGSL